MRRVLLLMSVVSLIAVTAGCGGGSSSVNSGSSLVTISVGGNRKSASISIEKNSLIARSGFLAKKFIASAGSAFASIPAGVNEISFTITGPEADFQKQSRRVLVVPGQGDITEQFVVPNGNRRHFMVEANDTSVKAPANGLLYRGENTVDLNGVPVTIDITMIAIPRPSLTLAYSITPTEVIGEIPSVTVNMAATLTNTGNETLNGIICQDIYGTQLTGMPASLAPGASATISGSYIPHPLNGPYSDTLTCSGSGAQSGTPVSQTNTASNNFTPSFSFIGTNPLSLGCQNYINVTNSYYNVNVYGNLGNIGNETMNNLTCSDSLGDSYSLYNSVEAVISSLAPSITGAFTNNNSLASKIPFQKVAVTCTGNGMFSNITFSNTTTLTCH